MYSCQAGLTSAMYLLILNMLLFVSVCISCDITLNIVQATMTASIGNVTQGGILRICRRLGPISQAVSKPLFIDVSFYVKTFKLEIEFQ